jgi:hypothetical protein
MCRESPITAERRKISKKYLRHESRVNNSRANRTVRPETLEKYSSNWVADHIRKLVIYNLLDLSHIVDRAIFDNIIELYLPNVFPLQTHDKYGYDVKPYEGLILGILAQIKDTNLTLIWHPDNADEIKKIS